jgi:HAD superfamily hydrolase (TIGR01490 family)
MNTIRSAAFFDLDRTLIRGDSQAMELRHILGCENPSPFFYLKLTAPIITGILVRLSLVSQERHTLSYMKTYRGSDSRKLKDRGRRLFMESIRQSFVPEILELIEEHRRNGCMIFLVSATPLHILEPVSNHLKPDGNACTLLDFTPDGRCTGRPVGSLCMGTAKAEQVLILAAAHRLDLSVSYAYSDHHADIPFLETVGHPTAVNPTPQLLKVARNRNWPVQTFSKHQRDLIQRTKLEHSI